MSQIELVRCTFCGARITRDDLQEGRSVRILRQFYCSACMTEAVRKGKKPVPAAPPPAAPKAPPASRVDVGPHRCGLYSSEEERRDQLGPFLREGLQNREKILRFLNLPTPERILSDFIGVGLPAHPYLQSSQFEILSAAKVLGTGGFNAADLAARVEQARDRAIAQGYAGLRIAAELTWALSSLIDAGRLAEFEGLLSSLVARGRCSALCQYNVYRLERSTLERLHKSHTAVEAKGTAESVLKELAVVG
jgi:hypothetical protein